MGKKDNIRKEKSINLEDDRMKERRQFDSEDKKKDSREFEHFENEISNNEVGEDATQYGEFVSSYLLILTLKYTKTAQNYQDKKTNNIKIVILK